MRNGSLYAMIPKNVRDVEEIKTFVDKWNFYESSFRWDVFNNRIKFVLCECDNYIQSESISVS